IAKVLDGGLTPQGRPYFAMEYVKGESITQFCDTRRLGMRERLELFCQACEAVQHAHLKGIIHRDLKPTNVLAFEVEGTGAKLKVIDFGVAKAVSQTLTDKTIFTETGQMIGTPEYMSPEQAAPGLSDIDTRSDIYSLGVILYELVTGETPFAGHGLRSRAHAEVQRILREEDPPTPSTRLSTLARKNAELASRIEKARGLALRDLAHALKSELEWIPMKAMRKEPAARYQTAIALAEDVRAYLEGRPISAAPETTGYRLKKYVQRHRGPVIAASLVIGALLLGLAAAAWQWRDAVEAKRAALEDKRVAEEARVEAERAQASEAKLRIAVEVDTAVDAAQAGKIGGAKLRLRELDPSASTRFDARYASARSDESLCGALLRHDGAVSSIAFDDVRGAIVSGGQDNLVRVWDPRTCMQIGLPLEGHSDWVECVAVRRDGSWYASGSLDETIRLWRPGETTSAHILRGQQGSLRAIEFSRDGGRIFGAGADGSVRCWDVVSGTQITRNNSDVSAVSDRPHGSIGLSDFTDRDEPFITGLNETEPNDARDFVTCLCSHPTEDVLVGGCEDGALRWWSTQTGEQLARVDAHRKSVDDLSFSRSGELLASAGRDGLVRLWISNTRRPLERNTERVEFEFDGPVDAVALSSDASMIAIGRGGIVELRNIEDRIAPHQPVKSTRVGHVGSISDVAFGADRGILATSGIDDTVRL
ncbi:MAG: protein kinase domain-containing protein, partial [bacterium]